MSANEAKGNELDPLEAQLAALRPRTDCLDRDRLMFLAGQAFAGRAAASGSLSIRFWRVLAGAMTAVAAGLLVVLICRPAPPAVQIALTPSPSPSPSVHDSIDDRVSLPEKSASLPPADNPRAAAIFGGLPLAWYGPPNLGLQSSEFLRLRAAALTGNLEGYGAMEPGGSRNDIRQTPPISDRQLLDSLLDDPAVGRPPHRNSVYPRFQGVHS